MAKTILKRITCVLTVKVPEDHTYSDEEIVDAVRAKANLPQVRFHDLQPLNDES